ncbi:CrcB family protein [Ornithinimicrobium ciconiae]|uniref:Fluoride-specific ion channel FluC n=1 Tax=Ornithinimicrobium ciconiae TaxID=2594265 RepID=A0A516G620_9MICO|nr:CrcB family protein [Ornithinimicrobium ciconiae]QDO86966.1 CrcB family protein [Ornithinimicrobium ciconiae]
MRPSPLLVGVVTLGGALGTLSRYAVTQAVPATHQIPWATLMVNLSGAFLLGLLLERLARTGPETPARRLARLGLGTGLLGGFTTYSALALEVHDLVGTGHLGLALGYGIGSVCAGLVSCAAGVVLGARGVRSGAAP